MRNTSYISVSSASPFLKQGGAREDATCSRSDCRRCECVNSKKLIDIFSMRTKRDASTKVSAILISDIYKECLTNPTILENENMIEINKLQKYTNLGNKNKQHAIDVKSTFGCSSSPSRCTSYHSKKRNVEHGLPKIDGEGYLYKKKLQNMYTRRSELRTRGDNNTQHISDRGLYSVIKNNIVDHNRQHTTPKQYNETDWPQLVSKSDLICRTMQRNLQLQKTVKKLILMRQRDKQTELWKKYINDLKLKYRSDLKGNAKNEDTKECPICRSNNNFDKQSQCTYDDIDRKYCNLYSCNQHIHNHNKGTGQYSMLYPPMPPVDSHLPPNKSISNWNDCLYNNPLPRCDNIQVKKLKHEKRNIPQKDHISNRHFDNTNLKEDQHLNYSLKKCTHVQTKPFRSKEVYSKTQDVQFEKKHDALWKHKIQFAMNKFEKQPDNKINKVPQKPELLVNIENKIDALMGTINAVLGEIKKSRKSEVHSNGNAKTNIDSGSSRNHTTSIYPVSINRNKIHPNSPCFGKSNTRDLASLVYPKRNSCSVLLTYNVHRCDQATDISDPKSNTQSGGDNNNRIKEINHVKSKHCNKIMNIAVNTDPIGLLGLLKISSDCVKQFLNLMFAFDYYSYLPMIQFSQVNNNKGRKYVCKICGESFVCALDLSHHIVGHDVNARSCNICHQMLQQHQRSQQLFGCQYCGQRFTRAYCCQLHQRDCATRLGKKLEDNQSLLFLS